MKEMTEVIYTDEEIEEMSEALSDLASSLPWDSPHQGPIKAVTNLVEAVGDSRATIRILAPRDEAFWIRAAQKENVTTCLDMPWPKDYIGYECLWNAWNSALPSPMRDLLANTLARHWIDYGRKP